MAKYTIYPNKSVDFYSKKGTKYTITNIKGKLICYSNGQKRSPTKEILSKFTTAGGKYTVFADGGCQFNPGGHGGYGAVIVDENGNLTQLSEGFLATTNNRMEIKGAIAGLNFVPRGSEVMFYSDSQYVVNTMNGNYKITKNLDLWEELKKAAQGKKVSWFWVKGHAGNDLNEVCDRLATAAMNGSELIEDSGYKGGKVRKKSVSAMTVEIEADEKVPPPGEIQDVCKKSISEFYKKENHAFKDYANIKTGGLDRYSRMIDSQLIEICKADISIVENYLDGKNITTALRWNCRGLSLKDSIRKVLVDMEIAENCK